VTASSPRPAGDPGISECTASCGADQDGGHWHSHGGYVWAQYPRRQPRPAAPDTTGGELRAFREQLVNVLWGDAEHRRDMSAKILALPALRDLLAERDKLAAQVQAVEALAEWLPDWRGDGSDIDWDAGYLDGMRAAARAIRRALGTPTTAGGE